MFIYLDFFKYLIILYKFNKYLKYHFRRHIIDLLNGLKFIIKNIFYKLS